MTPEQELFRHQSECREWLRRRKGRDSTWWPGVLAGIASKRGMDAATRLDKDVKQQWQRGNRGREGDWRE
jgi:hypothetical protein